MRPNFSTWACFASFLFSGPSFAAYNLKDDYSSSSFFSMFDFFTDSDPTDGYVDYQSQSAAQAASLISTANNQIYMGVDSTSMASGRGRKSVRVTSKAVYNHALIVLDLEHMPGSICGTWPAFWTVGPDWPNSGEIDIIEGVNTNAQNAMTLHTGPGCSISGPISGGNADSASVNGAQGTLFSGSVSTSNCDINAAGQAQNAGCSIGAGSQSTYGDGLNSGQGGVYATEWLSTGISIWFFPRSQIPSDLSSGSPDPSGWGTPVAHFGGSGCDIDDSFKNQQIVFDTTFCGQWAGAVWSTDATCSSKAATCQDFVQNNPSAFQESFWTINSLKVFTSDGSAAAPPSSSSIAPAQSSAVASGIPTVASGKPSSAPGVPIPSSVFNPAPGKPTAQPTINFSPSASQQQSQPTGGQPWNNGGGFTQSWSHGGGHHSQFTSNVAAAAQITPTDSPSVSPAALYSVSAASATPTTTTVDEAPYAVVVGPNGEVMEEPMTTAAAFAGAPVANNVAGGAVYTVASSEVVSLPTTYDVSDPEFTIVTNLGSLITTTFMTLTQSQPQPAVVSLTTATATTSAVFGWETWARRDVNDSAARERREEENMQAGVHAHMNRHRRDRRRGAGFRGSE